jgi:hypothetical protein
VSAPALSPGALWRLGAGFALWGSALATLYALHAVGCAFGWSGSSVRAGLAALLVGHLALIAALIALSLRATRARGTTAALVRRVGLWTLSAALIATAITFAPPIALTACL